MNIEKRIATLEKKLAKLQNEAYSNAKELLTQYGITL